MYNVDVRGGLVVRVHSTINLASSNAIERSIVGLLVHAPETHPTQISQTGAEPISEQVKQAKDHITVYVDTF